MRRSDSFRFGGGLPPSLTEKEKKPGAMSDSDDLSTTASSGSETDSSEEAENLRANSDAYNAATSNGLDSTTASAREEFKRLTRETDEKNKALQRDRSTHSDLGRASPLSSDSASSDSDGAAGAARRSESKNQDSGSVSGSESSGESPKAGGAGGKGGSRMVSGQHHDEEMDLEMRWVSVEGHATFCELCFSLLQIVCVTYPSRVGCD